MLKILLLSYLHGEKKIFTDLVMYFLDPQSLELAADCEHYGCFCFPLLLFMCSCYIPVT